MSKKGDHKIDGYFDYVVPPLEGFWWQDGVIGVDYTNKDSFQWISVIRLPDFVTKEDFDWAVTEAAAKKKQDFSKVEFLAYDEGLCVQCMHIGSYDDEPATVSGGELRAEVLANYLRHERLPDCTFLPENALYQRTYGTLPEGGVIIQQSHKRSQAARSFAA